MKKKIIIYHRIVIIEINNNELDFILNLFFFYFSKFTYQNLE